MIVSPLEELKKVERSENVDMLKLEKTQLMEKPQNLVFKNASLNERPSNVKNNSWCDETSAKKCVPYSSRFLQLCTKAIKYYVNGLAINGEQRVEPVSYTHLTLPTNREV